VERRAQNFLAGALGCVALFAILLTAAYGIDRVERLDARTLRSL